LGCITSSSASSFFPSSFFPSSCFPSSFFSSSFFPSSFFLLPFFYAGAARSRSGSSSFTASALNKLSPSSSSSSRSLWGFSGHSSGVVTRPSAWCLKQRNIRRTGQEYQGLLPGLTWCLDTARWNKLAVRFLREMRRARKRFIASRGQHYFT